MKICLWLWMSVLAWSLSAEAEDKLPKFSDHKVKDYPDLNQKDPLFKLFDDGKSACGPTAAANGIIWLSKNGYPKLIEKGHEAKDIVRELDELSFRKILGDAVKDEGTFDQQLLLALVQYTAKCSYRGVRVNMEGSLEQGLSPDLKKLKSMVDDSSAVVLLHLGWFEKDGEDVRLKGGHWVTATGFGDRAKPNWQGFQVSDPDDKVNGKPRSLPLGTLNAKNIIFEGTNKLTNRDRTSARSFVLVGNGILKSALVLKMDPKEKR